MAGRRRDDTETARRVAAIWAGVRHELTARIDEATLTAAEISRAAGISETMLGRILDGSRNPSLATLVRLGRPLNFDASVRLFAGTGLEIRDRFQARIGERLAGELCDCWRPHPEIVITVPARGSVDLALAHDCEPLLVATEIQSELRKVDSVLRWSAEKAAGLAHTPLAREAARRWGVPPDISRLLVVRSTSATRAVAAELGATLLRPSRQRRKPPWRVCVGGRHGPAPL